MMLTALFFANFLARILLSPLMPTIETDLGLGHGAAGSLFLCITIGYFPALLGSALLAARLSHRQVILLSVSGLGLSMMLTAGAVSEGQLKICLVLLGFFAGFYLPSAIASLTRLVPKRNWGKAISIHELAPNLSFAIAPLVAEWLLVELSWREGIGRAGIAILVLAALYLAFGKGGRFKGTPPRFSVLGRLIRQPAFWRMVALFSLAISSTLGVYSMLPLYLIHSQGMSREAANTLISISRILPIPMALAGGWATDRFGAVRTLRWVLMITGSTTGLMALAGGQWIAPLVALQPVAAVCFFPAGFRAIAAISTEENRNIAIAFTVPLAFFAGGGIIPSLIGHMGDAGHFPMAFALLGTVIVGGSAVVPRLDRTAGSQ
jgi:NNP family nitrate/nitrite transporter-like MFS transporter